MSLKKVPSGVPAYHLPPLLATATMVCIVLFEFFYVQSASGSNRMVPVAIVGVQHLGPNYNIGEFYVNKYGAHNVGREGGGGSEICCAELPATWRPNLVVEVRWQVNDWTHENRAEIKLENYRSVTSAGQYIAVVPVEKYDRVDDLYVHFFPNGKVRVFTSPYFVLSKQHPVLYGPRDGGELATAGKRVDRLFNLGK